VQCNQVRGNQPGLPAGTATLKDVMMRIKFSALGLALVLAMPAFVASVPANAEQLKYDKHGHVTYGASGPNVVVQQGPHTRLFISKRSWLDAGTEVLPGDRKFTDYAFPPEVGFPSFARENNNRPIDRQPLNPPSDLGGEPTRFPLY
jgi:hypothetical protein